MIKQIDQPMVERSKFGETEKERGHFALVNTAVLVGVDLFENRLDLLILELCRAEAVANEGAAVIEGEVAVLASVVVGPHAIHAVID